MAGNGAACCCSITISILVIGIILLITLLTLSINKIEETEVAVVYHDVSRKIDGVIEQGWHTSTPDVSYFKFQRTYISEIKDYTCLSKDGLKINLKISSQYQHDVDKVLQTFLAIGKDDTVRQYVLHILEKSVREVCGTVTAGQFFQQRQSVENNIKTKFQEKIYNNTLAGINVGNVQLRNFQLPTNLLNIINQVQETREEIDIEINKREEALIREQTKAFETYEANRILLIKANTEASSINIKTNQEALVRENFWTSLTNAFLDAVADTGLTAEEYINMLRDRFISNEIDGKLKACLRDCQERNEPSCSYCWIQGNVILSLP